MFKRLLRKYQISHQTKIQTPIDTALLKTGKKPTEYEIFIL